MVTPIEDYVALIPDELKEETGGLFIPDELKEKPRSGTVKAVGKGKQSLETGVWIEVQVKEGDRVLFKKHGNTIAPVVIDGVELLCMRQGDILLIL